MKRFIQVNNSIVVGIHPHEGDYGQLNDDTPYDIIFEDFEGIIQLGDTYVLPVIEPVIPIPTCSPWQIRKALNQQLLREQVETMVANSTDITLKDGWEFASEFRADDPFVITMGTALGKTQTEIDDLIQFASTL